MKDFIVKLFLKVFFADIVRHPAVHEAIFKACFVTAQTDKRVTTYGNVYELILKTQYLHGLCGSNVQYFSTGDTKQSFLFSFQPKNIERVMS